MNNSWRISNGRILDPASGRDETADLVIVNGLIAPADAPAGGLAEIDASGMLVVPGLIDLHVHFREPGKEEAETIESGSAAAARGGFTTVVTMPNTTPATDTPGQVADVLRLARSCGRTRILPCGCITRGREGKELADIRAMAAAGAAAVSDDGDTVRDPQLMADAMLAAREAGIPVMDHALDPDIAGNGVMLQGAAAHRLGLPGIPPEAEPGIVERDIDLAERTQAAVHIQHLSSAQSVDLLRSARGVGLPVSAELTPHHLALTDEDISEPDPNLKMNPPLGSAGDRNALTSAVVDGTIQALATDHAPHRAADKIKGFLDAPFGVVGLETAVGVTYSRLVATGLMTTMEWLRRWTTGPAAILGLEQPSLAPGRPADITILDVESEWTVDAAAFLSKSTNTPFGGMRLHGRATHTLLAGKTTWGTSGNFSGNSSIATGG